VQKDLVFAADADVDGHSNAFRRFVEAIPGEAAQSLIALMEAMVGRQEPIDGFTSEKVAAAQREKDRLASELAERCDLAVDGDRARREQRRLSDRMEELVREQARLEEQIAQMEEDP
jgi:hypothetical protein